MRAKKVRDSLELLEHTPRKETISIIPIPLDLGSDNGDSLAAGPGRLLKLGAVEALESAGLHTKLLPAVKASRKHHEKRSAQNIDQLSDLTKTLRTVRDIVHGEIARGHLVLSLGGDHALSIGTIAGASSALRGDIGVVWIDVHGDAQTHATSLSQNPHGMATTALFGMGDTRLTDIVETNVRKNNILYLGHRDLDRAEIDLIRAKRLMSVTLYDIATRGLSVAHAAIEKLAKRTGAIWISLDLDSIDLMHAPGSAMAAPGGFSRREVVELMTYLGKRCNVVGLDVVEFAPAKDVDNMTGDLAIELAAVAFGAKYTWYTRYMSKYGDWYSG